MAGHHRLVAHAITASARGDLSERLRRLRLTRRRGRAIRRRCSHTGLLHPLAAPLGLLGRLENRAAGGFDFGHHLVDPLVGVDDERKCDASVCLTNDVGVELEHVARVEGKLGERSPSESVLKATNTP
jgi:hypothetical protein